MPPTVAFDFTTPELCADPWPAMEAIRAAGPVVYNEALDVWHVHRYADVGACFADSLHFSSTIHQRKGPGTENMISTDPPDHDRLRAPFQGLFTKRELNAYEARLSAIVDDLFEEFVTKAEGAESADIVKGFADQVPAFIIAEMLGVPTDMRESFHRWANDIVNSFTAVPTSEAGAELLRRGGEAWAAMGAYLGEEIASRNGRPSDDIIGQAIAANIDGAISDRELTDAAHLFLVAGNDTTAKQIAWTLVRLAQFPDQRRLVLDDPALLPSAIDEVLRYEPLSLSIPRLVVGGPVEVAGETIPDDAVVWLMSGLANRDPDVFERPGEFDILRPRTNNHFGFGYGTHLCLGANLARMEVRLAVSRVLERFPSYEVRTYALNPSWSARGPVTIDFVPGAPAS